MARPTRSMVSCKRSGATSTRSFRAPRPSGGCQCRGCVSSTPGAAPPGAACADRQTCENLHPRPRPGDHKACAVHKDCADHHTACVDHTVYGVHCPRPRLGAHRACADHTAFEPPHRHHPDADHHTVCAARTVCDLPHPHPPPEAHTVCAGHHTVCAVHHTAFADHTAFEPPHRRHPDADHHTACAARTVCDLPRPHPPPEAHTVCEFHTAFWFRHRRHPDADHRRADPDAVPQNHASPALASFFYDSQNRYRHLVWGAFA